MKLLCKLGIHLDRETIIEDKFDVANRIARDVLVDARGWYLVGGFYTSYTSPTCEKAKVTEQEILKYLPNFLDDCEVKVCLDCGHTPHNYNINKVKRKVVKLAETRVKEIRRKKLAKSLLEQHK